MAVEIKQTELHNVQVQEGIPSSELNVPKVSQTDPVRTDTSKVPVKTDPIQVSLDNAVLEGSVGYYSPEVKAVVLSSTPVKEANKWIDALIGKKQRAPINNN